MFSWESIGESKLKQDPTLPYLTESDISVFESVYHSHFYHSHGYIDFSVPHEILNLMIGTPSKMVSYDSSNGRFISKFSNLHISGCSYIILREIDNIKILLR